MNRWCAWQGDVSIAIHIGDKGLDSRIVCSEPQSYERAQLPHYPSHLDSWLKQPFSPTVNWNQASGSLLPSKPPSIFCQAGIQTKTSSQLILFGGKLLKHVCSSNSRRRKSTMWRFLLEVQHCYSISSINPNPPSLVWNYFPYGFAPYKPSR